MNDLKFQDVCNMARENGMILIVRENGFRLCDEQLKTLVTTNSLSKMAWFINNCDILGIVKV